MGGRKREKREKEEGVREKREGGREREREVYCTHTSVTYINLLALFLFSSLVPLPLRMTVMMTTIRKEGKNPRPPSAGAETSKNIKWAGLAAEGKGKKD